VGGGGINKNTILKISISYFHLFTILYFHFFLFLKYEILT
jgi:hypothetical protein